MSDLDTKPTLDSAPTSATSAEPISAASNKRAASPDQEEKGQETASKASKRAKGENGEIIEVKQEQGEVADENKNGNGVSNGEGHSAKKMDDDRMEG